jgi:hypothetical protein
MATNLDGQSGHVFVNNSRDSYSVSPGLEALTIVTTEHVFAPPRDHAGERRLMQIFCLELACISTFLLVCGIVDMVTSGR